MSISVIIPNYNGKHLLNDCLNKLILEIKKYKYEIIVVDNASTDDSVTWIRENFPFIKIIQLKTNIAIFSINEVISECKYKHVLFLNNDVIVGENFLEPMIKHFERKNVFAVTSKVFDSEGNKIQGYRRYPVFSLGWFWYLSDTSVMKTALTLHALGGQSVFDRDKFISLGKFDPLFSPFYHEDLDISYRAYKRGWEIIYEPESIMYHIGAATASRYYTPFKIKCIMQKNMFLFIWKNISDFSFIFQHMFFLPIRLIIWILKREFSSITGFLIALISLPEAISKRKKVKREFLLTDKEIIKLLLPK